jgi:hypothetical protein
MTFSSQYDIKHTSASVISYGHNIKDGEKKKIHREFCQKKTFLHFMLHELSVGAISEKIKFSLQIMVLRDMTPSSLVGRHIHCHENLKSYTFSLKFMAF